MDLFPYSDSESDASDAGDDAGDVGDAVPHQVAVSMPTADDPKSIRPTASKSLPSVSDVLSSVARPAFLDAGKPTATEKRYYGLEFKADGATSASATSSTANATPAAADEVPHEASAVIASALSSSSSCSSSGAAHHERLSQRAKNRQQEARGQATFTLKDGRDLPDLYRPSHGVASDPAEVVQQAARGGRAAASGHKRASANLLVDGIANATATRDKKARDTQMRKVNSGQSFEGRTWKSEAEMVMRQQYD